MSEFLMTGRSWTDEECGSGFLQKQKIHLCQGFLNFVASQPTLSTSVDCNEPGGARSPCAPES